jgi:hypothetical protein
VDWEVLSAHQAGRLRSLRVERCTFEGGGAEVWTAYRMAVVPQQDHIECTQGLRAGGSALALLFKSHQ